jgi:hypothetical protein
VSYARFGSDGSDVYVFTSSAGLECCGCILQRREWEDDSGSPFGGYLRAVGDIVPYVFDSNAGMIAHLELHRAAGHHVPEYVFDRLRDPEDEAENRAIWAERAE